jgi:hypothetical protein
MLPAEARHSAYSGQNERSGLVAGQRRGCDTEETEFGGEDGLFLELVVPNSIIASDNDPSIGSCFAQPDNVLRPLRKQFIVNPDV